MKRILQGIFAAIVGVGVLSVTTSVSANGQYSATRSNSVKLVWRKSMGRHAFTATQGARYSRHLAIRYSNNDVTPNVTWYTDAHEKFYKKYKGRNAIYYHVKSADGTLQGWIWRGYLKPLKATVTYSDKLALQGIKDMGSGAQPDEATMALAKTVLTQMVSTKYHFTNNFYDSFWEDEQGATPYPMTLDDTKNRKQYLQLLKANHLVYGYGFDKAMCAAAIGSKEDAELGLYRWRYVEDYFTTQNGIGPDNYFKSVKIGIATTRLANGKYASFGIARMSASYANLNMSDEID